MATVKDVSSITRLDDLGKKLKSVTNRKTARKTGTMSNVFSDTLSRCESFEEKSHSVNCRSSLKLLSFFFKSYFINVLIE